MYLRPRPVSSVAFAYLSSALRLNHSIERRPIYSRPVFRCDIRSVVEMSAERRDNGLGLGGVITAHGGEDGTVMG
jgi:hypothetical protein